MIDFIITMGDNLYPKVSESPTEDEFKDMLNLFSSRTPMNELPVWAVRGNHDCYFDFTYEL